MAFLGMVLALDGIDPFSGERLLRRSTARVLRALMATCGLYDGSGEFGNLGEVNAVGEPWGHFPARANVTVPPLGSVWLRRSDAQ